MSHSSPPFGIDNLLQDALLIKKLREQRVALLSNQSSQTQTQISSALALKQKIGGALKCLLTPEHGWTAQAAEGIAVPDGFEGELNLPIFSLYGGNQAYQDFFTSCPIEILIIDLQDMGLRCYTYAATCAQLLEKLVGKPIEVFVCDRPNPLGPAIKGPFLDPSYRSIVSYLNVPFQHGQTLGQLLEDYNYSLGEGTPALQVISCLPYVKPYSYSWIPPSPNLPSWEAALLYPALVLLEGTNISEGRGTPRPFTSLGAPGLDGKALANYFNGIQPQSIHAEPITFTPTTSKHKDILCYGVEISILNSTQLDAFALGIHLMVFLKQNYSSFQWVTTQPPLKNTYWIDYLLGTPALRLACERSVTPAEILTEWKRK